MDGPSPHPDPESSDPDRDSDRREKALKAVLARLLTAHAKALNLARASAGELLEAVLEKEALQETRTHSERNLQALMNAVPFRTTIIDSKGRLQLSNDSALNMLRGADFARHVPARVAAGIQGCLRTGTPYRGREKLGDRHLVYTVVPSMDDDGRIERLVVIEQDITFQMSMKRHGSVSQKLESLGTMAAGIAHDFNNKLGTIAIFSQLAMEVLEPDHPVRKYVHRIQKTVQTSKQLTEQVLTFGRGDTRPKIVLDPVPVLRDAVKFVRRTSPPSAVFHVDLPDKAPTILANSIHLHQIVLNLTSNSLDAMPDQTGDIWISLDESAAPAEVEIGFSGPHLLLTFRDNGCGMNQETLEKALQPFFTTKVDGKGSGMGLSVVHGIVKGMGATMRIDSSPETGTAFFISIPIYEPC